MKPSTLTALVVAVIVGLVLAFAMPMLAPSIGYEVATLHAQAPNGKPDATPVLTEVQRLKLELINAKAQLANKTAQMDACQARLAPSELSTSLKELGIEFQAMISAFELEHPGYTLDTKTLLPAKKAVK